MKGSRNSSVHKMALWVLNELCLVLQVKVKAKELRGKKKDELLKQLDELKTVSFYFVSQYAYMCF